MPKTGFSPTLPTRLNVLVRSWRVGLTVVMVVPREARLGVDGGDEPVQPARANTDAAASTATIRTKDLHCVRSPGRLIPTRYAYRVRSRGAKRTYCRWVTTQISAAATMRNSTTVSRQPIGLRLRLLW